MTEQRNAPRWPIGARFRYRLDSGQVVSRGVVVNMSRSGMLLQTAQPLQIGSTIHGEIEEGAHDEVLLRFQGRVVRTEEQAGTHSYACRIKLTRS